MCLNLEGAMAGLAYEVRGGFCADFEGGIRHWNIHRYVLVVLMSIIMQALLSPAVAGASSSVPGTLGEQAKIDQNGSFNFTVPIEVPPGINGTQPRLALSYNSQQSSGIFGMGWALSGIPTIERTKRIRAIDGVNGTIAYDAGDRFALQGQRLLVTSGQYGVDGSVYRTEIESWQLVTAHGAAGAGPSSFTVQSRDGSASEFGNTPDSRILAAGRQDVRSWNVNQVTDINGNATTFTYTQDPLNSGTSDYRAYPVQIAYTGNGSRQPDRFVRFLYEANPEAQHIFIGGSVVQMTARVSHIQTFAGQTLVSDYRLSYDTSAATGRSRLVGVTRYPSTAAGATPLAPATFSYINGAQAFTGKQNWLSDAFSKKQGWDGKTNPLTIADVNGDGFLDIVGFKNGVQVALGGPTTFQTPTNWLNDFSGIQGWTANNKRVLVDINGDGLADIVGISNQGVVTALSNGTTFVKSAVVFPYFSPAQGWTPDLPGMLADVNGDHIMDIVGVRNGTAYVALGNGDGSFSPPAVWLSNFGVTGNQYQLADLNGDGNADIVVVGNDQSIRVALSTGSAFDPSGWKSQGYRQLCKSQPVTAQTPIMFADVNGDGLADIVAFCDAVYTT